MLILFILFILPAKARSDQDFDRELKSYINRFSKTGDLKPLAIQLLFEKTKTSRAQSQSSEPGQKNTPNHEQPIPQNESDLNNEK